MSTAKNDLTRRTRSLRAPLALLGLGTLAALHAGCGEATEDPLGGLGGDGETDASFSSLYSAPVFQKCAGCHAPGAQGRVAGIETTQNWSSRASAYSALKTGKAQGLTSNFAACNGVPLIGASAEDSLLVAALDESVRESFAVASAPDCNGDTISDMTLKLGGPVPSSVLAQLKAWIDAGAPDN